MLLGIPVRMLRVGLLGVLITFVVAPIVGMPYQADDTVNRNWPLSSLPVAVDAGVSITREWMVTQGRFFPGGLVYGITMWSTFDSRVAYMTYLALLGLLLVALVGYVIWRATRSGLIAALGVVALGACMQVRLGPFFDGLASFGGLAVYTLVLTIIAGLLVARLLRGGARWLALPAALAWSLAITAYEVSLLMLPAILLLLVVTGPSLRERARWLWALIPLVVPAAIQIGITAYLRQREVAPGVAYQVNLDGPVGTTFGKQFTAALPLAQEGWGHAAINPTLSILLVVAIGLPLALAWRPWSGTVVTAPSRLSAGLVVAGLWAWIIPSVLADITVRWQNEIVWGQGYIYLVYEWVGFVLVVAGLMTLLRSRADRPWARVTFAVVFIALVAACAVSAGMNIVALGGWIPGAQGPG